MADRVYTKEEADRILSRAIELHGHGESMSHAELVATAREIGVGPEALDRAAAEVLARKDDDAAYRALRARQWRAFYAHLVPFACVGVLLGFLNVVTGGFPWAVIPMLGWTIGLASHLFAVAMPDEEKLRKRIERKRERERQREGGRARVNERFEVRGETRGAGVRVGAGEADAMEDAALEEAAREESAASGRRG